MGEATQPETGPLTKLLRCSAYDVCSIKFIDISIVCVTRQLSDSEAQLLAKSCLPVFHPFLNQGPDWTQVDDLQSTSLELECAVTGYESGEQPDPSSRTRELF